MITELKIKLIFLRLLKREPLSTELTYYIAFPSEKDIIDSITSSSEYQNMNSDFNNRISYDTTTEQITISASSTNDFTFVVGSEQLEIQASTQYNITGNNTYHEGFSKLNFFSLCDVRFFTSEYESSAQFSQNVHVLDTHRCSLIHSGVLTFNLSESVTPVINFVCHRRCLQNYPSCVMQTFSITSNTTMSLPIFHCFPKDVNRNFDTFVPFNSDNRNAFYITIFDDQIYSTHVIQFTNDTVVTHHGLDLISDSDNVHNTFYVDVIQDVTMEFHIISFISNLGSSASQHANSILAGLINMSPSSVIQDH